MVTQTGSTDVKDTLMKVMEELSSDRRAEVLQFALFLRSKQKRQASRQPVQRLEELWGDFWPEDESVNDFIDAVRRWRKQDIALHKDLK